MSSSTTDRSGSQNNSERPSSSRTSTAACSDCPQHTWIVPHIPANWLFQCPSLTRTTVPLRASYASKKLTPPYSLGRGRNPSVALIHPYMLYQQHTHVSYYRTDVSR